MVAVEDSPLTYSFGNARLNPGARQLFIKDALVDVQPKVFDLIVLLAGNRERVVSKDELFDEVWPDVVVTEATLSQTVKRARDLFRDHGFSDEVIRTLPRRGFQFVHQLNPPSAAHASVSPASPDFDRKTLTGRGIKALGLLALAAGIYLALLLGRPAPVPEPASPEAALPNSLAVLPFESLAPDSTNAYLADGLTETIINNLTQLEGLRVIARSSAYAASREADDRTEIARDLKVAQLLIGSVQVQGQELRVSASLVSAADDSRLWSRQYTRLLDDVFAVQDDISRAVVDELATILGEALPRPAHQPGREDAGTSRAYRLVLRARQARRSGSVSDLEEAERLFREAYALASNFPEAMAGLADVLQVQAVLGVRERGPALTEAVALLRRATQLPPAHGTAFALLAEVQHRHLWNFPAARDSFERALTLQPGSSELRSRYSRFLAKSGDHEQAAEQAWLAADLDPRSINTLGNLAMRMVRAERLDEARTAIDTIRRLDANRVELPWLETHWHLAAGTAREALEWIAQEALASQRQSLGAIALHRLGRENQARETLQELIDTDKDAAFQIAEVYAQFGELDASLRWLEQALAGGDPGIAELYSSPHLQPLYRDARFEAFAEKAGLPALDTPEAPDKRS